MEQLQESLRILHIGCSGSSGHFDESVMPNSINNGVLSDSYKFPLFLYKYYIYLLFLSYKRYFLFLFAPSIITSSISVKIALVRAGLNPIYFTISLVFDRPF